MIGIKLMSGITSGVNVYGTKLMKFSHYGSKPTHMIISRVYSQEGRETIWKTSRSRKRTLAETALKPSSGAAISVGEGAVAGASIFGLGALAYYGLGLSNQAGIVEQSMLWPQYVRDRVRSTYGYFGSSLLLTGAAAVATFRTPALLRLASKSSLLAVGATLAAVMGTGMVTHSLEYAPTLNAKHLSWIVHSCLLGAVISPLALLGGPTIMRALWYTAGTVGGLTTIALCAPSDRFLYLGGPLAMGLGFVFMSSIGTLFLPPTTALGSGLMVLSLYGGLILFSGFLLYDTQRIIHQAENYPLYGAKPFDPINASLSIYMDTLNIFIRLATIFSGAGGSRKR